MPHIDDWLDDPTTAPTETMVLVKEWLEHFRRPAIDKDHKWLSARKLFCTYDGERYRCIGCSRMGDVWLTKHFERENGYDDRVDISDCTEWEVTPNDRVERPGAASGDRSARTTGCAATGKEEAE